MTATAAGKVIVYCYLGDGFGDGFYFKETFVVVSHFRTCNSSCVCFDRAVSSCLLYPVHTSHMVAPWTGRRCSQATLLLLTKRC